MELLKKIEDALALKKKNGNTLCKDAMVYKIKNVNLPLSIVKCHMVFDIKMEFFRMSCKW